MNADSREGALFGAEVANVVRASPHYFNTHDELDQLIDCVARLTR